MPSDRDLFQSTLDLSDLAARTAYLDEHSLDAAQRTRVEKLLTAHTQVGGLLEDATTHGGDSATADPDGTTSYHTTAYETTGTLVAGRYKLLQQIGEGGMGTVWMADQLEPVKRKVAVKLIRAEKGSSATILARFEAERQAIALMDHPHIAKLLDAGCWSPSPLEGEGFGVMGAHPFFVMELLKGVPLTDYCELHQLRIPERLHLFQQICGAVQHAHQKGIIHRDLKPSNILVESHDGKPVPKVIDFGLAKATNGMPLTENTLFTGFGTVMGTPTYMAPEQASFNPVDIDTRADVYALGVILYELLTGTTPIMRDTLKKAVLDEILRLVREQEAPTPSSRLAELRSGNRGTRGESAIPHSDFRIPRFQELDWIVLKALAKDRDRRYASANDFAADVGRFLNHEPVMAGPPSRRYRLRKFVRRNRPQVIAAGLVLLTLLVGVIGTTLGLLEARHQRDRAIDAEVETATQLTKTQQAEELARIEAAKATAAATLADTRAKAEREMRAKAERQTELAAETARFMTEVLTAARPSQSGRVAGSSAASPTVKQALDVAAANIETRFRGQTEIEMMVRVTVGKTYRELGEYAAARPHLERCLALAERDYPTERMVLNVCRRELAMACGKLNDYKTAERLFQLTIAGAEKESGPFAKQTLSSRNDLAQMLNEAGEYDRAERLFHQLLADAPRSPDDVGSLVCTASSNLGLLYTARKKYDLAEPLFVAALKWAREHPGESPELAALVNNLANLYWAQKRYDLAEPLFKEAYERLRTTHSDAHPTTLTIINNLAGLYLGQKKYHLAEPLLVSAVAACRKSLGPTNLTTLSLIANLGTLYRHQDKDEQAEPLLIEALTGLRKHAPTNHPITLNAANILGELYRTRKDYTRAEPLLLEAANGREKKLSATHPDTGATVLRLIALYEVQKKYDRAEPWMRKRAAVVKGIYGEDSAEYAIELSSLGRNLIRQRKYADAEPLLRACLAIREKKLPDSWALPYTSSMIGECLAGQGKFAAAEPILLAAYDGMTAHKAGIPPDLLGERMADVVYRLMALYTDWGKPDEAKKWRAKVPRETPPPPRPAN